MSNLIQFDGTGNMVRRRVYARHYDEHLQLLERQGVTERGNYFFRDTLQLQMMHQTGNHYPYFKYKSVHTNKFYFVFASDINSFIAKTFMGTVDGLFRFRVSGKYQGIYLVDFEDYIPKYATNSFFPVASGIRPIVGS